MSNISGGGLASGGTFNVNVVSSTTGATASAPTTFQMTSPGAATALVVPIACSRVEFRQDPAAAALVKFVVHSPLAGTTGKTYAAGDSVTLAAPLGQQFASSSTVCFIEVLGGGGATFHAIAYP